MLRIFRGKPLTCEELADQAERILSGQCWKWDADNYEHAHVSDPQLKDLHVRTIGFGLPEEWVKLDDPAKNSLRRIIEEMRQLELKKL
jgi:hypothetical protein